MARLCEGRVAIVTGGARGVGREHCLMLAEHGAKVVVNDLGGDRAGAGQDISAAQQVVNEIKAKGGASRLYRFKSAGMDEAQYFDEFGKNIRSLLLRTTLDTVRVTSSFGMREHPILGFSALHAGVDFAAPPGTGSTRPARASSIAPPSRAPWDIWSAGLSPISPRSRAMVSSRS